ncbi:MAG: hypothetical protein JST00_14260 [Deltaproteobacteria bacterium]|nr:hypothetical protein [Deltaproteobacteria bacterium]
MSLDQELQVLADHLVLGSLLDDLRVRHGAFDLLDHWQQGEFHHDVVVRLSTGSVLVVATNCNGGVKEVLAFDRVPDRAALWHWRCPSLADFSGDLPPLLGRATTPHWFDPCDLLGPDARSELREEVRERQPGGGWRLRTAACGTREDTCGSAAGGTREDTCGSAAGGTREDTCGSAAGGTRRDTCGRGPVRE